MDVTEQQHDNPSFLVKTVLISTKASSMSGHTDG